MPPMYSTQTIASILEPVAQQVSKLIILHEEGEDGNAMPDLEKPVLAVSQAVANLTRVGKETVNSSQDSRLKSEMPKSLSSIENAADFLERASKTMKADPYSQKGRDQLITGSRGILQGTTNMLLAFDQSQVRKLCRDCKRVLDYLAISEVIETMEDLVQYVKDLSPCLSKVCRDIDARRKDLLNPYHRDSLAQNLEQIKTLAPILICSMKIFIQIHGQESGKGAGEAVENRNYLAKRMTGELIEMMKILEDSASGESESTDSKLISEKRYASNSVLSLDRFSEMSFREIVRKILLDRRDPDPTLTKRAADLGERIGEGFEATHVKADILSLCSEIRSPSGKDPETIKNYLANLENKIIENVIDQIIHDMADIFTPLKQFCEAVTDTNIKSLHHKREIVDQRGQSLKIFSNRLSKTASLVSYFANGAQDKRRSDNLRQLSEQIGTLTPQLINAGTIKINYPDNRAADENFENLTSQFADGVQSIRDLCDETVDLDVFLRRTEEFIRRAIQNCESVILHRDKGSSKVIVDNAAMAARLSNRLLFTLSRESDNSEDARLRSRVHASGESLKSSLTPFLENSKCIASNVSTMDRGSIAAWRSATAKFLEAIAEVSRIFNEFGDNNVDGPPIPPLPSESNVPSFLVPPRPPLPGPNSSVEAAPPRPPLPSNHDTDDEEGLFAYEPGINRPIHMAAHGLYQEIKQWDHSDNEIIAAAKKIAYLMAHLSELIRGGKGTKKELITCAKGLADQSEKITELAKELAKHCTDKKIRTNLLQVCEKIPTLGTQLRVLSTVKATMMGQNMDSEEDQDAMDMLVFNAQKLNLAVKETVRAAESASIRVRSDAGFKLKWIRKQPWFQ